MRKTFIKTLLKEAKEDTDIFLITGDLGFMALEEFRDLGSKQFLNIGVAEQNMIAFAAGLALTGKKVYTYSIVPFITMRPFEFVRNDICYHNLDVTLVGPGAGFSYSYNGPTHYGLEDISVMRSLPNMVVVCPGDPVEVKNATLASLKRKGPMYIRLGKAGEPVLHKKGMNFKLGKAFEMQKGKDITLIATGNILQNTAEAGRELKKQGIDARVLSMHTIKPIDRVAILKAAKETKNIITIEEHSIIGGLGSAVAEVLAENNQSIKFKRLGVTDVYPKVIGSQKFLRGMYSLSVEKIVAEAKKTLKK